MAQSVWKITLVVSDIQEIEVPKGSVFLHAAEQYGDIAIWFRCDPDASIEKRKIRIAGTGGSIDERLQYIGTAHLSRGQSIFHVFEVIS